MIIRTTGAIMLTAVSVTTLADAGEPTEPPLFVEDLGVLTLGAAPPNNIFEEFYRTEVLPLHGKQIRLAMHLDNFDSEARPATVTVWLDWRFGTSGPPQTTVPDTFEVLPNVRREYHAGFFLPISPSQVSVHIQNNGPGAPVIVAGALSHQSVFVPEPGITALGIVASAGVLGATRRKNAAPLNLRSA